MVEKGMRYLVYQFQFCSTLRNVLHDVSKFVCARGPCIDDTEARIGFRA